MLAIAAGVDAEMGKTGTGYKEPLPPGQEELIGNAQGKRFDTFVAVFGE